MKCAYCRNEIRSGSKKCLVCGHKVDLVGENAQRTEERKINGLKSISESEKKAQRDFEEKINGSKAASSAMILSIISTVFLIIVRVMSFKELERGAFSSREDFESEILKYYLYFGVFIAATIITIIAVIRISTCITNKCFNRQMIIGCVLTAISIIMLIISLADIGTKKENLDTVKNEYEITESEIENWERVYGGRPVGW